MGWGGGDVRKVGNGRRRLRWWEGNTLEGGGRGAGGWGTAVGEGGRGEGGVAGNGRVDHIRAFFWKRSPQGGCGGDGEGGGGQERLEGNTREGGKGEGDERVGEGGGVKEGGQGQQMDTLSPCRQLFLRPPQDSTTAPT